MNHFLDEMNACVNERVKTMSVDEQEPMVVPSFCELFYQSTRPVIIAEIKFSSPSLGVIYHGDLSAVAIARQYRQQGAHAISIVTEPHFFKGTVQTVVDVHKQLPDCPLLFKDFILTPIQIKQAQRVGASAVLLIVGFLDESQLRVLYEYAVSLGLTPLIEVHNAEELEVALAMTPQMIGINNRNLKTMTLDLHVSKTLIQQVPDDVLVVCESGMTCAKDINAMRDLGCDGFLIGSHLMRSANPGDALRKLLQGVVYAG